MPKSQQGYFDEDAIKSAIEQVLKGLKINVEDANFFDTPKRVAKMFAEIFEGLLPSSQEEIKAMLSKTFPCDNQDMIIIRDIICWSMCPHHLLPVKYCINMAYIPNQKVLGLSKLPRLAILLAKQPILQEQLVHDIALTLEKYTKAKGVIVNIRGAHLCMQMRGVKAQETTAEATSARGCFIDNDSKCKDEFMSRISNSSPNF